MANPVWRGEIAFALVNIPITLYTAERRVDLRFNMLDSRDKARVRYERVNAETGEEVPWDEIAKGYEYDKGDYVLMQQDDFQAAAPEATETIEIERFVAVDAIGYRYFDRPYYLVPEKRGRKSYVLLRETLAESRRAGTAKVVIRSREHLAALVPEADMLVLHLLRFAQELRDPNDFDVPGHGLSEHNVSKKEQKTAQQLVESMAGEWRPQDYHDDYREALLDYIEKKIQKKGGKPPRKKQTSRSESGNVVDLSERLEKSLREQRGGQSKSRSKAKSSAKSGSKSKGKSRSGGKRKKLADT